MNEEHKKQLIKYTKHRHNCDLGDTPDAFEVRQFSCTCGLDELLDKLLEDRK